MTVSGAVQLGLVLWAAARAGMALHILRLPSLAPEVRQVLRKMVPGVLGAGVTQLNLAIDVIIASFLPAGAVSYLYYADRVGQLPLGVIGAAVGTAMLPLLSRQVRSGESLSAHRTMNRAVELSLLLCLPAAVGQAVAAEPIVTVLFQRGVFGLAEAQATAAALSAYAIGLPAYVLVKIFAPGFFARGDTATPVKVGLGAVALNLALNLILTPWLSHVGVALATALSAWANALALGALLWWRGHFLADRRLRRRAPRLLLAALLMGGVLLALGAVLFPAGPGWRFAALAALIGAGMLCYFGAAVLLRVLDWRELRGLLRRRRKPAKA
ncbi:murein biosynthesis integral membrane protein MurJ [Siccirubricoccus deserti]